MTTTPTEYHTPGAVLDCGHVNARIPGDLAAGYATMRDGRRICYACADAAQREELRTADKFGAYLDETNGRYTLTTWTGGLLARVTSLTTARNNFGGGERYYFRAIDVHGAKWHGTSPGPGMFARMHRSKR